MRIGLTWCAIVVTAGGATSIVEAATGQTRAVIEGALALSAIALFPGLICFALSWIVSPPREP